MRRLSCRAPLLLLAGLMMMAVCLVACLPLLGLEERTTERHIAQGSPFGIQDLVETRLGEYTNVVEAGVAWVRLEGLNGLNWALVDDGYGVYDWTHPDRLVQELTGEGLQILWTVSSFHPSSGQLHYLPEDMEGYLRFLSTAAERYDGDGMNDATGSPVVDCFQIENEVDGHFWEDTAANYADLLHQSIRAVKLANSAAKVAIAGASTPDGYYRFYPEVLAELDAADEWFDVMDVHWYESVGDYAIHPKGDVELVEFLADLRSSIREAEVWFTEVGTHSGSHVAPKRPPQTEKQQACELVKRYTHFVGNGVARVFWHTMLEGRAYTNLMQQNDFFDNTGLIYNGYTYLDNEAVYRSGGVGEDLGDGVKKLAYYSYKLLAERLANYAWVEPVLRNGGSYAYRFHVEGSDVWVAWADGHDTVTLPFPDSQQVIVTDSVPSAISGDQLDPHSYPSFFEQRTLDTQDGSLTLLLDEVPVIVEQTAN